MLPLVTPPPSPTILPHTFHFNPLSPYYPPLSLVYGLDLDRVHGDGEGDYPQRQGGAAGGV